MDNIEHSKPTGCAKQPSGRFRPFSRGEFRKSWREEDGVVFASTAIIVSVILGLVILYLSNSTTLNINEAMDVYSAKQSYWSAISGIEYALQNSENGFDNLPGGYSFYNSAVYLSVSNTDQSGVSLPDGQIRVISLGRHAETERILEVKFKVKTKRFWPELSLIEHAKNFKIKEDFALNDSLYIGGNVWVDDDAKIGDPPGDRTNIYVPSGKSVTGDFDARFSWSVYPAGSLSLFTFSATKYDSLLAIAKAITSMGGNKCKGDYTLNGGVLDLSSFANRTFFVKGKLTIKGGTITGGSVSAPGIIVVTDKVEFKKFGTTQTFVNDNIIIISRRQVELKDRTKFGTDYSYLNPSLRPTTVNEIFAYNKVEIGEKVKVWAQIISSDRVKIEGRVYGVVYSKNGLEFDEENAYLEGALFVRRVMGNKLEKGKMNLNHSIPAYYFAGTSYQVIPATLKEI